MTRENQIIIEGELNLLKRLSNPRCSKYTACYYNHFKTYNTYEVIMEIVDGVELECFLNINSKIYKQRNVNVNKRCGLNYFDNPKILPAKLCEEMIKIGDMNACKLHIFKEICTGIQEIHNKGIAHMDLKPENIMLTKTGDIKILDFGLSCDLTFKSMLRKRTTNVCHYGGTPAFSSPEMLEFMIKGEKKPNFSRLKSSDVFSFGAIMYNLTYGKFWTSEVSNLVESDPERWTKIYGKSNGEELTSKELVDIFLHYVLVSYSPINDIIGKCMQADSGDRPSINQVCKLLTEL